MPFFSLFRRKKRAGSFRRELRPSVNDRPFRGRPVARTNKRLPALPVEIVLYIFQLSVEDSAATACTLARLCTQTRDRVRHALYVQPTLSSVRQINLFLRTVKRAPDLARLVTRLRLDGGLSKRQGDDEHGGRSPLTTRLAKLLELCPALEALELRRVVVFSLTDFANARQLRHLAIVDSLLSDRTTTSRFTPFFTPLPSVETLVVSNVQVDGPTAAHFLSTDTLPRLKALSLEHCRLVDDPVILRDLGAHNPAELAAQLELLSLTSTPLSADEQAQAGIVDPFDLVERCGASLRHLALPVAAVTGSVLDSAASRADVRPRTLAVLAPSSTRAGEPRGDPFDPHLVAAQALSTAFLDLAVQVSASASLSSAFARRSPLTTSTSAPASLYALSDSAAGAPGATSLVGELEELVLPTSWDRTRADAWRGNGEFDWAVARILRECERRGMAVRFGPCEEEEGVDSLRRLEMQDVIGWKGDEMLKELERTPAKGERAERW